MIYSTKPYRALCVACFALMPALASANSLVNIIKEAIDTHPAVQTQLANNEAAQSNVDVAKWQYYPTPSVSVEQANASSKDLSYQGDDKVSIIRLQQPVWTGGRLSGGLDKAEAEYQSSISAIEETKQSLALQATQAYGEWLGATLRLEASQKSVNTHRKLKEQIGRRLEQGLSPDSDLTLASSRLAQAEADQAAAFTQQASALAKLAQLLGRELTTQDLSPIDAYPVTESSRDLIKQALNNSPTKQKLTYTALASKAEMEVQSSSLYPEVYVRAEQQYGNYVYSGTEPVGRIFVGVQSSFGAGLSSVSRVEAARAKIKAAESELVTNERTINEQITTEWSNVKNVKARLVSLRLAQKASEEIRESWDRQFVTGRKSWLDVMNAAKELAQTELQLAEAQASLIVSSWRIAILTQQLNSLIKR